MSTSPISKLRAADDEHGRPSATTSPTSSVEAKILADLKIETAAVEGERRKVEADLGPVRYLATLLRADSESALRYFILAIALDPAAVLLLLAASRR